MLKLSERIKKLRKENNLTQTDLAKKLGFSRTTIANYEQGKRVPSPQTIYKLAELFEVNIDYLFGRENHIKNVKKWFEQNRRIFFLINTDNGNIIDCSSGAILFYGYSRSKLKQKRIYEISNIPKNKVKDYLKCNNDFIFKDKHLRSNGEFVDVEVMYFDSISDNLILILILPKNLKKFSKSQLPNHNFLTIDDYSKKRLLSKIKKRYIQLLCKGKKEKAYSLIVENIIKGIKLPDIYLNILEPALKHIGHKWENGKITVAQEHLFSNATVEIINRLHSFFPATQKKDLSAVAITAQSELHEIGLKIVTDFLKMDGWATYYLGKLLPKYHIINTLKKYNTDLLIISATMNYNLNSIEDTINTIKSSSECKNIKILVGGRAFNKKNNLKQIKADGYAKNAKAAVKMANQLINN